MTILRSIVQKGLILGDKIRLFMSFDIQKSQHRDLVRLIKKAKKTAFGTTYQFDELLQNYGDNLVSLYTNYAATVPISDYSRIYSQWWNRAVSGEENVCWPGKVQYFALSSGTSDMSSKRIPVTQQMLRQMTRSSLRPIYPLVYSDLKEQLLDHDVLLIGGCTTLQNQEHHQIGDLSGIQAANLPVWFLDFYKPGKSISSLPQWKDRIDKIIEEAPNWDIGVIVGIPSWIKLLMERILERYQVKSIHEIWPNLFLCMHSGVSLDPYRAIIDRMCTKELLYIESYLASEGFIAYQESPEKQGMTINTNAGIFYEFVEFNHANFDENGEIRPKAASIMLQDIKTGVPYAIIISTCSGAWRYLLGDVVQFSSPTHIKIIGRTKQFLNICGEHLSVDNTNQAILAVANTLEIDIPEYTIVATQPGSVYCINWYIATDNNVSREYLKELLDQRLRAANDDYNTERESGQLQIEVYLLPSHYFYEFLEFSGRLGAQNKIPRISTGVNSNKWLEFLNYKGIMQPAGTPQLTSAVNF